MIGQLDTATYTGGEIKPSLLHSLYLGYPNTVYQYGMANTISFPLPNLQTLMVSQSDAQVDVIGYRNNILDTNFNLYSGEFCSYSKDWYMITGNKATNPDGSVGGNGGIKLQSIVKSKTETAMMGESTNQVLLDIMTLLDKIVSYLNTMQQNYVSHGHTAPSSGGDTGTPIIASIPPIPPIIPIPPFPLPAPDPALLQNIDADKIFVGKNVNLAGDNYSSLVREVD